MPLSYERPNGRYMQELERVGIDAAVFAQRVRDANNYLGTFPERDALVLSARLEHLKNGTAEGGRPVLELAAQQLTAWRYDHILHPDQSDAVLPQDEDIPPTLNRGGDLDIALGQLITQVNTALQSYWREAGGQQPDLSEPEVELPKGEDGGRAAALTHLAGAAQEADRLQRSIQPDPRNPAPETETSTRILVDIQNQATVGEIEVRQPKPRERMLTRIGEAMTSTFKVLESAEGPFQVAGTVIVGAGTAAGSITLIGLGNLITNVGKSLTYLARKVRERRAEMNGRSPPQLSVKTYDSDEARAMILRGDAPPPTWTPFILALDFSHEKALRDLSALSELTELQMLDLEGTTISDVAALSGLSALQSLDLRSTKVSDVSVLSRLTMLRSLRLTNTQVSDISALSGLTGLRSLTLTNTNVIDISPISTLTELQRLKIANTEISDISPLSGLTALETLSLRATQVSDVSALSRLTALRSLDLRGTRVRDLSPIRDLEAAGLEILTDTDTNRAEDDLG